MSHAWSLLAADVQSAWVGAQAEGEAGRQGRNALVNALQALVGALETASGTAWRQVPADHSVVASFRSLQAMAADPHMQLPLALSQALQMTHRQLAELQLRQAQSLEDPQWLAAVVGDTAQSTPDGITAAPAEPDSNASAQSPTLRDWWSIPDAGLSANNRWFLSEARDLLRGADLALVALGSRPDDLSELQVLLRALQAVDVSAQSMGLHRVAAVASEGHGVVEPWIDAEQPVSDVAWSELDGCLSDLYAELMGLVGEPDPGITSVRQPHLPDKGASQRDAPPVASPPPSDDSWGLFEPLEEAEAPLEALPQDAPPIQVQAVISPAEAAEAAEAEETPGAIGPVEATVDDSWGLFEPLPPAPTLPPPWWTSVAWSVWAHKEDRSTQGVGESSADPSREPSLLDDDAERAATGVRVAPATLQLWADQLSAWTRALPAASEASVPLDAVHSLLESVDAHRTVLVDSAAVAVHRAVRRAERARGLRVAFAWNNDGHTLDALLLPKVLPVWEALITQWVEEGLSAFELTFSESAPGLCSAILRREPAKGTGSTDWQRMALDTIEAHASVLPFGAAWRVGAQDLTLTAPSRPQCLPILRVRAGKSMVAIPLAWVSAIDTVDETALRTALRAAQWPLPAAGDDGEATPLLRLGALMRPDRLAIQESVILRLGAARHRLALQAEACEGVGLVRPSAWPAGLEGLRQRAGAWGVATDEQDQPLIIHDPFALAVRYGAAARVLSRPPV